MSVPDFTATVTPTGLASTTRDVLRNTDHYTLGTWVPATYPGSGTINFGGTTEALIRPPCSASMALATSIATGAYDATVTGVSQVDAITTCVRLIDSLVSQHASNVSGGWGMTGQSALWSAEVGTAAWFLQDHLTDEQKRLAMLMVVAECNRRLGITTPFWKDEAGVEQFAGDTKAEENAWNSMILQLGVAMLPDHSNVAAWRAKMIELMASAFSREEDLTSGELLDGVDVATYLNGWNINSDGTLINHNIVHPDYQVNTILNMQTASLFSLVGESIPAATWHNADLTWDAMRQVTFAAPPYEEPGGTIYMTGSDVVYYPEGTDWGTSRRANFATFDAMVDAFGITVVDDPAAWGALHMEAALAMQERDTTGQTYQSGDDDIYAGREQWVAEHIAWAWLAQWVTAAGLYP